MLCNPNAGPMPTKDVSAGDIILEVYPDGWFLNFVRSVEDAPNVIRFNVDRVGLYRDGIRRITTAPIYSGAKSVQPLVITAATWNLSTWEVR